MSLQDTAQAVWNATGAKKSNEAVTSAEIDLFAAISVGDESQQALTDLAQRIWAVIQQQTSSQGNQQQ